MKRTLFLPSLIIGAAAVRHRRGVSAKARNDPSYDCNNDGAEECKRWDYGTAKCGNEHWCEYQYKFGDFLLDQSCRCKQGYGRPTEYDCDGDGHKDCESWDYGAASCGHGNKCSYQYRFGDSLLDHSCRCKPECLGANKKYCEDAPPAPAPPYVGKVVTLGDSYQAGTGIHTYGNEYDEEFGGYIPPYEFTWRPDRDCWRDKTSTPGARYGRSQGMESIMLACKGAQKPHVENQFSYLNEQHPMDAGMKWNHSVLIVGVAGNNIRTVDGNSWPGLIAKCVTQRPCHNRPENQIANFDEVEEMLVELYDRIAREASAATIRVIGYPRVFGRDREGNWFDQGCWNVVWIMREEADWIDAMVEVLDRRISSAVSRTKAAHPQVNIEYVSTLDYINKGACASDLERMVNKEVLTLDGASDASFHMSQLGFDQAFRALVDSLRS